MDAKLHRILFITVILLCGCSVHLFSQQITLKGKIVDEKTGELLSYANVVLMTPDSAFVKGSNSDDKGNFSISAIVSGDYLLSVSFLGYDNSIIKLANLSASIDLGEIYLQQDSRQLNEVVVKASGTINKVDRQVILPTSIQIKSSNSGYELLNNLMLPGLRVDPIQNSIAVAGGGNVQIRINDILASMTQVKALRPSSVLRVEYIDNPGVRYGNDNVSAVVNFIVKRLDSGVSINTDLQNAPLVGFANDLLSIRTNHKQSEFGFDYFMNYRNYKKRYSDNEEKYTFPSEEIQRNMKGMEQPFGYTDHTLEATYNLTQPDKYVFHAGFKDYINHSPNNDFAYQIKYNNPNIPDANSRLHADNKSNLPSLDLYYQLQLPKKQSITLNTVGTIINTHYDRSYFEYQEKETSPEFAYSTDGEKYSFIGEGIYDKVFTPFKLTSGLKYSQSYTKNTYIGATNAITQLHNSNLYAFVQLQGKLSKISYIAGLGLSRSSFKEAANEYAFLTFQPNVSLSYPFLQTSYLRYRFSVTPLLPSLSALSNVRQDLDDFRVNEGNPNLKPYRRYRNSIVYQYKKSLFSGTLTETYDYYQNPIMENIFREDGNNGSVFVYTRNNQKKFQRLGTILSLSVGPVKDIVSFSLEGGVNRYFSTGNNYYHQYTNGYIGATIQAYYKNWIGYTSVNTRENSLYGETISMGESLNNIALYYTIKNCRLGLSMLYPYSDAWKAGSENLSDLAYSKSWTYIKENGRMLLLNFAWNVNYGKKHQSGQKKLNNSDTDSGIVK
ncbi:TonB-dependent receptor [Bacteroidia bacterium]|nr:TonB-dependent receptor [Bacteroidia bacterium]